MWLLAIDDFIFADYAIPPAMLTNRSSHLGFGVDRRAGIYSSVFFGATAQPATWNVVITLASDDARDALIAVLAAQRRSQFRLLAQREPYGGDLVVTEGAITEVDQRSTGAMIVTFESNDSVWLAEELTAVAKTFTSPLDQTLHLPVRGNVPTSPIVRITPQTQRAATTSAVGWRYRRRFALSNEGDEPLFRYPVLIDLGNTAALVSGGKARADGADFRVWLHGLEQARTLIDWNTSASGVWVIVPVLPPGQSLTYDVLYGNALATADDAVELAYPDLPAFDIEASTNYAWIYRTAQDVDAAGGGLWHLSSSLEGGSADYGVPGAWQPALTFENPNNTDNYVQPRSQRINDGASEWYQARLYAARWRGPGFDNFDAYAGSDPFDGVTIHNPFGVRAVHSDGVAWRNDASILTVVTTTVGATTESSEVLVPQDPPFTRVVVIGRNSGGEGWHVLEEYGASANAGAQFRLYLPSSGAAPISPSFTGWDVTTGADRLAAVDSKGATAMTSKTISGTFIADVDHLLRQYVYPLPAGIQFTTADTVKGQLLAAEGSASFNIRAQMRIRVMTASSLVKATLLDFDEGVLDSEFANPISALTNRFFPRGGAVTLQDDYTTASGDYLVIEYGVRNHAAATLDARLRFGDAPASALPEDQLSTADNHPWIEFSTDLDTPNQLSTVATTWVPPRPMKHFGVACWPAGGVQIPEDAESRVFVTSEGDMTVSIAAEPLFITEIEDETEIYELATELRLHGGANAAGPYHTLLVGNARQRSGPGTPRAAVALGTQGLQIDTERRAHTIWEPAFNVQEEALSAHAVRALSGALRTVDATEVPALQRIPVAIPNSTFDSDLSGWELEADEAGWFYTVTHDPAVGGVALGSMKLNVIDASPNATILRRATTYVAVEAQDSVEVSAWMRQNEGGASFPRLGVVWYDDADVELSTSLDQGFDVDVTLSPEIDHQLVFTGAVPTGATQFRIVLGITSIADVNTIKWFDDVTATIVRPLRYDVNIAKVTEEIRASQWLPLPPPRRTVANGSFDVDLSSWELADDGTGITYTVTHDPLVGGEQPGSLKIDITANSGSDGVAYVNAQYFGVNGQERVELSAWVRTSEPDIQPRLAVYWYQDDSDVAIATSLEPAWADEPVALAEYTRVFAAIVPPEATRFRLAVVADVVVSTAIGTVWFDDVRLNDNDLFVADVAMGELDMVALIRPRWVP